MAGQSRPASRHRPGRLAGCLELLGDFEGAREQAGAACGSASAIFDAGDDQIALPLALPGSRRASVSAIARPAR